jgi:hypothetical protein
VSGQLHALATLTLEGISVPIWEEAEQLRKRSGILGKEVLSSPCHRKIDVSTEDSMMGRKNVVSMNK